MNRAFLEEPQPRVHEEEEERGAKSAVIKKDDFRLWYECFIQGFTMVSERKELLGFSAINHFQQVIVSSRLLNRKTCFQRVTALPLATTT